MAEYSRQSQQRRQGHHLSLFWKLVITIGIIVGLGGIYYAYVQNDQTNYAALNPQKKKTKEVEIKAGASPKQMGLALKKAGVLRSERAFAHYVDVKGFTDLKSGYYELSPAMTVPAIVDALRFGGSPVPINSKNVVVVREGEPISDIAKEVGKKTNFSEQEFLKATNDPKLFKQLQGEFPGLLDSAAKAKHVRYRLEGYLYPATYPWRDAKSVNDLIETMVQQEYYVLRPRFADIKQSKLSIQELLTLASLVEREGVDKDSRRIIAGVFLNRLAINMPIQSDVATKYALNTKKTNLTNQDVQSDSPYNLYKFTGLGPGPFNNPSIESIDAVLNPKDRDAGYLYFVANLKTGKVYYSQNYDAHLSRLGEVDATNQSLGKKDQ